MICSNLTNITRFSFPFHYSSYLINRKDDIEISLVVVNKLTGKGNKTKIASFPKTCEIHHNTDINGLVVYHGDEVSVVRNRTVKTGKKENIDKLLIDDTPRISFDF